jgi:quinol monooxygenase YgiN
LEIECRIRPGKQREFQLSIAGLLQSRERASMRALVYEEQDDPGHILCVEEWADQAQLEAYLKTDDFLALLGACHVLGEVLDCRVVELAAPQALQTPDRRVAQSKGWRVQAGDLPANMYEPEPGTRHRQDPKQRSEYSE